MADDQVKEERCEKCGLPFDLTKPPHRTPAILSARFGGCHECYAPDSAHGVVPHDPKCHPFVPSPAPSSAEPNAQKTCMRSVTQRNEYAAGQVACGNPLPCPDHPANVQPQREYWLSDEIAKLKAEGGKGYIKYLETALMLLDGRIAALQHENAELRSALDTSACTKCGWVGVPSAAHSGAFAHVDWMCGNPSCGYAVPTPKSALIAEKDAEIERLRQFERFHAKHEEDEGARCPEDVGCIEWIDLRTQHIARLNSEIAELRKQIEAKFTPHCETCSCGPKPVLPEGCACTWPEEWSDPENIPPVCHHVFVPSIDDETVCKNCEHEAQCHKKRSRRKGR